MGWIAGRVYRQKITIQEGNVFADHTDFPVAIKITGANEVFTKAQSDGYDIVFAGGDDVPLFYERVRWDPGSQILFVYVRTNLSSSEATEFYMYYGNGGNTITTDGQNKFGTWNTTIFRAVYHFEEASGNLQDSTSNARHSTSNNQVKYRYAGLHSYACYFDGSDDYFTFNTGTGLVITGNTSRSITAYFYPMAPYNSMSSWESLIRWSGLGGGSRREYMLSLDNASECSPSESIGIHYWGANTCTGERVVSSGDEILTSVWHQYAGRHDGSEPRQYVYLNGTLRGQSTYTLDTYNGDAYIGRRSSSTDSYYGRLSEMRLYNVDIGAEWIRTEYENMINNDTFFVLAAEEDTPYLIEDIPTAITIFDAPNISDGTRNYLTEFTLSATSTVYYDMPTDISLADIVQTISGTNDIAVELGLSASGILTDAELDTDVDFYVSSSGIFNTDVRDIALDFTVGRQPVPITDPYGGIDVRNELGIGYLVAPLGYGEDVDVEFIIGTTYDTESNLDVDFSIATSAVFNYETEAFGSTYSGIYFYPKRLKLTIDSDKVSSTLTNFPLTIHLSSACGLTDLDVGDVFNELGSNYQKLYLYTAPGRDGGTDCYIEVEEWDEINKTATLHAKIPSISSSVDTILYLYYEPTDADNITYLGDTGDAAAKNVWNSDFEAVYHMAEDPTGGAGAIKDSTSNVHHGTPYNMASNDLVDGKVGKCLDFDGSNDYINLGNIQGGQNTFTWELITSTTQRIDDGNYYQLPVMIGTVQGSGDTNDALFCVKYGDIAWYDECGTGSIDTNSPIYDGAWYHVVAVKTSSSLSIWKNGTLVNTYAAGSEGINSNSIQICKANWTSNRYFGGKVDEVRFSNIARPSGWVEATYYSLFDELVTYELPIGVWLLADLFETDVTVSGALSYPIEVDVFSSVSGTQYNIETDLYISLANTTPSGLVLDTLISGSYYDAEVTISGAIWYPVVQDIYVSLADSVSGMPPVMPPNSGGAHFIDQTVASGNYMRTDMRLHALQIDNFFLDVDEYTLSTSTMAVDITDRRGIQIDTFDCYFIIDGVTITSGIYFTPVERTTASGYRMHYDPPGDFVANEPIEVIVHGENVINDWLEETYTLLWGYNLLINRGEFHSWGWDKEVVVWSKASNVASCPAESADAWHIRTAPQPYKDLAASIVPQVKRKDLSAVIYPISTAIFYGEKYKITVNLKDLAGNEMPPFTLEFTVEDKPN